MPGPRLLSLIAIDSPGGEIDRVGKTTLAEALGPTPPTGSSGAPPKSTTLRRHSSRAREPT